MASIDPTTQELEIIGSESDCSYLPGRASRMQYRLAMSLTEERYLQMLERGWRRFGRTLFRPVCANCCECQSLRVDINKFQPSKSQRRARNRNSDVVLTVQPLTITSEHLDLYNAYHLDMHQRRQWPFRRITEDDYYESFVDGDFAFSREFQYRLNGKLVALGIVDAPGDVMSSIYFVHDPELRERGFGTMSVLRELDYGRQFERRWLYMGYYIRDCGSMNYKNRFRPHQILAEYCEDDDPAVWMDA
ncbi:arginyltransferase [Fuerstiella marisgermanici]|uniref:Aspartate/glutamate leucyltransferase n=1 Tax=Fuerstiella marisgermanici TaxID=1891926 RepID=A0A1P8WG83_9PLAN|nr:arginyltransferase [Fuerstiella marisgermanici]APZ93052.1 arginyl-tRNA-protein transferase [Fuerstiella marisgermanici]